MPILRTAGAAPRRMSETPDIATPRRWFPRGRLARSTLFAMSWQGARVAVQTLWIVVAARLLGPEGYGTFSGLAGLANALGGFVGLGLGLVMYQEVASSPAGFGLRWRQTVVVSLLSGLAFGVLLVAGSRWSEHAPLSLMLPIAISELLCIPLVTGASFAFSAHDRMGWASALAALLGLSRVVAACLFGVYARDSGLTGYVWFHAAATAGFALCAVALVQRLLAPQSTAFALGWRDVRDGLGFSMVWVTGNSLASLDKALVLRFSGAAAAGIYASAYRLATVFAMPMEALVTAAMPRLFREGNAHRPRLTPLLFVITLGYGVCAGAVLWLAADLLPVLLGEKFRPAVHAARWLGLFLPCYGIRVLGGSLLLAMRRKTVRVVIECGGLLALVLFGAWWLPTLGVDGALRMVIATELLLGLVSWSVLWGASWPAPEEQR